MDTTTLQDQIRQAIAQDPRFPEGNPGTQIFCDHVPQALMEVAADLLDKPFDLLEFLRLEGAFLRRLVSPESDFTNALHPLEAAAVEDLYGSLARQLDEISEDLPSFLEENGMTEEMLVHNASPSFNSDMLDAYDAGTLTFGQLITTQPGVFIPQ